MPGVDPPIFKAVFKARPPAERWTRLRGAQEVVAGELCPARSSRAHAGAEGNVSRVLPRAAADAFSSDAFSSVQADFSASEIDWCGVVKEEGLDWC